MKVIEGKLEYLTWRRPWKVEIGDRFNDISIVFWDFAERLKGKRVQMSYTLDSFTLAANEKSDFALNFEVRCEGIALDKIDGFGFSNVLAYCESAMHRLNGREIIVAVDDVSLKIFANATENVPEVKYKSSGNMARVPEEMVRGPCGLGEGPNTCIFLVAGSEGFECAKFEGSLSRQLLGRKAEGAMHAKRIGNCRLIGRED